MKPLQPGQKPTILCNNLRAALPAHVCVAEHIYFFWNRFLLLLPPSTRAQCLATKLTDINELAAFADLVHTTNASTLAAIKEKPDNSVCATTTQIRRLPPSASTSLPDLTCFYHKSYGAQALRCKGGGCPKSPPSNKTPSGNAKGSGGSN